MVRFTLSLLLAVSSHLTFALNFPATNILPVNIVRDARRIKDRWTVDVHPEWMMATDPGSSCR